METTQPCVLYSVTSVSGDGGVGFNGWPWIASASSSHKAFKWRAAVAKAAGLVIPCHADSRETLAPPPGS